jgi:hypothetical protein
VSPEVDSESDLAIGGWCCPCGESSIDGVTIDRQAWEAGHHGYVEVECEKCGRTAKVMAVPK